MAHAHSDTHHTEARRVHQLLATAGLMGAAIATIMAVLFFIVALFEKTAR